jgi:hypothetical protein
MSMKRVKAHPKKGTKGVGAYVQRGKKKKSDPGIHRLSREEIIANGKIPGEDYVKWADAKLKRDKELFGTP